MIPIARDEERAAELLRGEPQSAELEHPVSEWAREAARIAPPRDGDERIQPEQERHPDRHQRSPPRWAGTNRMIP